MKKMIALSSLAVLYCLLCAQSQGPDGNTYDYQCEAKDPGLGTYSSATAWYNDPDGDCISNDFIIRYTYPDGRIFNGDEDWFDNINGNEYGKDYNFNDSSWECCGNTSSGGNSDNCKWVYQPETNTIKIDCDSKGN